jgi:hypothetical protein
MIFYLAQLYLCVGFGFYFGVSVARIHVFDNATLHSVIKGFLFNVLLWPIAAVLCLLDYLDSDDSMNRKTDEN